MAKVTGTWKIIRGIISSCESQEEIASVVDALRDNEMRENLIKTLFVIRNEITGLARTKTRKITETNDTKMNSEIALYKLFRERLKMTNSEVEEWFSKSYGLKKRIGKSSLIKYLRSILEGKPTFKNDIVSRLYKEYNLEDSGTDLRIFWDALDARAKGDDNVNIQRHSLEISPEFKKLRGFRD
jgi:hypothetical protein